MSSLLSADLAAACNALGYFDSKSNKYYADANTLETVKDLIRYLRRDDETHDIRRQLGESEVLQSDLLPLLKSYWEEADLFDVLLRLIVNLTTPALILWNEQIPTEKITRNFYLQVEDHLQSYKEAFADETVWAVLSTRLSKILEIDVLQRGDENSLIIERILILIRNILYVPADVLEKRPDNDASAHDQVLWALHQSGMLDIILYITSSASESAYYLHILEILSFMLREQNAAELAQAALQRSQTEKLRDEAELLAIRHNEINERQKKTKAYSGTRHSRFGGTFVVKSMKSISDKELIYHKPLGKLDSLNFDVDKTKPKTPKNRLPVKAARNERRSAFSIRLFLKEFCVEFLNGAYNTLMYHVKDNLVRAKAQAHDESYYLWAMRFFMEFNRCYKFEVKLVSETMAVQAFHYVQQQSETFYDLMTTDKKKLMLWSRRLHLALLAYRELFMTLAAMDKSPDGNVRDSSRVIKSNIFYVLEYREFIITLLVNYDELKMSDTYLKDMIETQHIFLKMLESFVGKEGCVVVQSKGKKKKKRQSKRVPKTQPSTIELNLDEMWDEASSQLSTVLDSNLELSSDITPFDAASEVPIDDQKAEAMKKVQARLRNGEFEFAVGLLRAAREVWPENDSFGSSNMAPEEEFLALRDIFFADLGENIKMVDSVASEEDNDNGELDEEEEGPRYNESNFKFIDFTKRLPHPKIVRACGLALQTFDDNSTHTNHCIVKLLHRIAFDCKMYVMVFQLSIFRSFHEIFKKSGLPQHKELVKFATYIVRQFLRVAEVNKKVFMEVLFWKSTSECYEIEHGYMESHGKKALQKAWSEEEEDEVRRLFMEHQQSGNEEDVVDWITSNTIDQTKSRRQILKKLKELMLLVDYKGRKKSGNSKSRTTWTSDEEENLEKLFRKFKKSDDPMANIMENLDVPRPKSRVLGKLLVMGLIKNESELCRKRTKRNEKSQNFADPDSDSDQSDADEESDAVSINTTQASRQKRACKKIKSSVTKKKVNKHVPVSKSKIAEMLMQLMNKEMRDSLEWLKESLGDASEDYEVGNNEGIPLVPVMDYAEMAMENVEFQQLLKALGVCPPFDEQEVYWRIPGTLTPEVLESYGNMIQQALDGVLEVESGVPIVHTSRIENDDSSDDEYLFNKIRTVTKTNTPKCDQGGSHSNIMSTSESSEAATSQSFANEGVFDSLRSKAGNLSKGLGENVELLEQSNQIQFHTEEFNIDNYDTEANHKVEDEKNDIDENGKIPDSVKNNKCRNIARHVFDSDSENEAEKRQRSFSSSDSEKPITKRARIIDSDDD